MIYLFEKTEVNTRHLVQTYWYEQVSHESASSIPVMSLNHRGSNCIFGCHKSIYSSSRHQTLFPELGGSHLPLHCLIKTLIPLLGRSLLAGKKMCLEFHHVILAVETCYGSSRNSWGPPSFSPRCPCSCHGDEGRAVPESALY